LIERSAGAELGTSTSFGLSMLMFISFEEAEYSNFSFIFSIDEFECEEPVFEDGSDRPSYLSTFKPLHSSD
jgi:hypothetical protein